MKKRINHKMTSSERKDLTSLFSEVLNVDDRVIFAYLYGSFINESPFRDIDVFVYLRNEVDPFTYPVSLKENLFDAVAKAGYNAFSIDDFDVRVINESPYDFAIDLLCEGKLIVDKDTDLRTDYIERISNEYRVNYFVLDEAYHEG